MRPSVHDLDGVAIACDDPNAVSNAGPPLAFFTA